MRTSRLALFAATAALVGLPLAAAPAGAADGDELTAELTQLNDSGASGTAWATVDGTNIEISLEMQGLLDGAPHAQHIHIGGQNTCPANDKEGNGFEGALQTSDGADEYGPIAVTLTKEPGMTGAEHGLDVADFPATASYSYSRTIEVSEEVAQQVADGDGVVVVHGVDHDGSGKYDGDTKSDLDPELPSEATDPAACGELNPAQMTMPHGGVETGGSSTSGVEYPVVIGFGTLALALGAFGLAAAGRRRATI
jgi:MYXO-CTERM domain-containing protein